MDNFPCVFGIIKALNSSFFQFRSIFDKYVLQINDINV